MLASAPLVTPTTSLLPHSGSSGPSRGSSRPRGRKGAAFRHLFFRTTPIFRNHADRMLRAVPALVANPTFQDLERL